LSVAVEKHFTAGMRHANGANAEPMMSREVAQLVNVTPGTLKITTEQSKRRGGASAAIWWRQLGSRACSVLSGRRSGYDASLVQLVAQPRAGAGDCECSSKETSPSGHPGGG